MPTEPTPPTGTFPIILYKQSRTLRESCPTVVPYSWVAPHEEQAQRNHGQSLAELKRRGGLDPRELWQVIHDAPWDQDMSRPTDLQLVAWLRDIVDSARREGWPDEGRPTQQTHAHEMEPGRWQG